MGITPPRRETSPVIAISAGAGFPVTREERAVNDILLYLDTHPDDEKALAFFEDVSDRRNQLLAEYAKDYGPLTVDTASKTCETSWKWSQQPFPWEREGA